MNLAPADLKKEGPSFDLPIALAMVAASPYQSIDDVAASARMLVLLDGVEDPHNLGAIIRTAHAAGADAVVIPDRRAAPVTEVEVPPAPVPKPVGPVTLDSELSVSCPDRAAPGYPPLSRRMGEAGIAVVRVELDEQGHVTSARVATGSGFARLDEAALAAVKTWRCNSVQRNGQAVRAVALQPFKFVLQGN